MGTKYNQITLEEREKIYALKLQGKSFRYIGKVLNRNHRTISREYKRNKLPNQEYIPCKANEYSNKRSVEQRTKAPLKSLEIYIYVRTHIKEDGWSPEQISGRLRKEHPHLSISVETIYNYIYGKGKNYKLWEYLPNRKKKRTTKHGRKSKKATSSITNILNISNRSTKANRRTQIGHYETDLMEGPRKTQTSLDVTVERKSRYTKLTKIKNKKAKTKQKVLTKQLKTLKSIQKSTRPIVRSITSDNGIENTLHRKISKKDNIKWYFCNPYHSWEKGTVERTIKEVRRYIPKGTSLNKITKEQIQIIENKINNRPMKCLNWLTPKEVFEKEVNKYKFKRYLKTIKWCTSS